MLGIMQEDEGMTKIKEFIKKYWIIIPFIGGLSLVGMSVWDWYTYYEPLKHECYGDTQKGSHEYESKHEGNKGESYSSQWTKDTGWVNKEYACRVRNGIAQCCEFTKWGNNNKTIFRFFGSDFSMSVQWGG